MLRTTVRAATAALGTLLTLGALAAPAAADGVVPDGVVPDGCAGSEVYVCTGTATPFGDSAERTEYAWHIGVILREKPLVPGATVGSQEVGGVAILLGGQSVPGAAFTVGPTGPVATGVTTPVGICAFVSCYPAGTPVDVPGLPLPVVPVVVPGITVPQETVEVPTVVTVPTQTTPALGVPAVDERVATLTIYTYRQSDLFRLAVTICETGGGQVQWRFDRAKSRHTFWCSGGTDPTTILANQIFWYSGMG